ncbi:MAG: hypothetical protein R3E89_02345 [Thiolinea sp.]
MMLNWDDPLAAPVPRLQPTIEEKKHENAPNSEPEVGYDASEIREPANTEVIRHDAEPVTRETSTPAAQEETATSTATTAQADPTPTLNPLAPEPANDAAPSA